MQSVNIGDLKNGLSSYLQLVKNGEEVVVRDRNVPVARILPFRPGEGWDHEAGLVASGTLKMPEEELDLEEFFRTPAAHITDGDAIAAALESRGDR